MTHKNGFQKICPFNVIFNDLKNRTIKAESRGVDMLRIFLSASLLLLINGLSVVHLKANWISAYLLVSENSFCQSRPKELDALARAISSDVFFNVDDWIKKQKMASQESAIKELRESILVFEGIKSDDPSITRIVGSVLSAAKDVDAVIDEIAKTPAPPSQLQTIIGSIIIGALADDAWQAALGGGALGAQQGLQRENYETLIRKLETSINRFYSATSLVPSLVKRYSAKPDKNEQIGCDITETITPNHPDFIALYNFGKELKNVSINIKLKDLTATSDNFVFVEKWQEKSWLYIPCQGKSTVSSIKSADISIYSEFYSTEFSQDYTKEEKEKDVKKMLEDVELSCKYQAFVGGIIWDTNRGIQLKMTGFPVLVKPKVTVIFSTGGFFGKSKELSWDLDFLENGIEKTFESKDFDFDPSKIKIKISLPYCDYQIVKEFNLK